MVNLVYEDISYKIRGAIFEVYNRLGYGHRESIYQKALAAEFELQTIPFEREKRLVVSYKNKEVGVYIPDFVIDNKVILEVKSLEFLPPRLAVQLTNYLKGTNFRLGFIANFGATKLEIIRRVWGHSP